MESGDETVSGSLKKTIWLILMAELVIIHATVLIKLFLYEYYLPVFILVLGSLIMAVVQYLSYRFFVKNCALNISRFTDEELESITSEVFHETKCNKEKVRVYENSKTVTPFVMGVFKQSIILPRECRRLPNLKLILLHECFHVKRRDTLYKYFMMIANCFLWFHPLAYMVRYLSYQDIEISCDEAVVKGKSKEERLQYGEFLIASARNMKEGSEVFNAYWNSSKSILKHRIEAVIDENRKWDTFAKTAIVVMVAVSVVFCVVLSKDLQEDYAKVTAPPNEYAGVVAPPLYTDEAIQQMLLLEPMEQEGYHYYFFSKYDAKYPPKEFEEIEAEALNPWQMKIKSPGRFRDAADVAIQRLYYYLENQTAFDSDAYEQSIQNRSYELVYSTLLAGDIDNSVWGYIWKVYCSDVSTSESLQNGYAFVKEGEDNWLYYTTAVQIRMTEPYLFEVVGFADLYDVKEAYEQKYETEILSYIPQIITAKASSETMTVLDSQKQLADAFAAENGISDVRISFPDNALEGYLLGTIDRAAMQVMCVLYRTEDGGHTWKPVKMDAVGAEHSVTYDFAFLSREEGYMAIHSFFDQEPELLRTEDGGMTWTKVQFSEEITDFCQAFCPVCYNGEYVVYVGKEGSGKEEGEKACYESADGGKTWIYTGQITFD